MRRLIIGVVTALALLGAPIAAEASTAAPLARTPMTDPLGSRSPNDITLPATESHILFDRNDGTMAVGHITPDGKFAQTDSRTGTTPDWTHVVAVGQDILFDRNDGTMAVGHITPDGKFAQTDSRTGTTPDWTHVVAVA
jgi:roadblock/LC7 domain-containing protein